MPLKTFVKVGRITNLSDARYCAGMGVDLLGFRVVEGQDNYLDTNHFQEIRGWVTGPGVVAELYGLKDPHQLSDILENYKPDYLELGIEEVNLFSSLPLPFILAVRDAEHLPKHLTPTYWLCPSHLKLTPGKPILVEIEALEDVAGALQDPSVHGISLQGSEEERPGFKDYEVLATVLEQLEED